MGQRPSHIESHIQPKAKLYSLDEKPHIEPKINLQTVDKKNIETIDKGDPELVPAFIISGIFGVILSIYIVQYIYGFILWL